MIERYQDTDLVVTRDEISGEITVKIVRKDDLDCISITWHEIEYGPTLYDRLSEMFSRIAADQRELTEEYEIEGDEYDD